MPVQDRKSKPLRPARSPGRIATLTHQSGGDRMTPVDRDPQGAPGRDRPLADDDATRWWCSRPASTSARDDLREIGSTRRRMANPVDQCSRMIVVVPTPAVIARSRRGGPAGCQLFHGDSRRRERRGQFALPDQGAESSAPHPGRRGAQLSRKHALEMLHTGDSSMRTPRSPGAW